MAVFRAVKIGWKLTNSNGCFQVVRFQTVKTCLLGVFVPGKTGCRTRLGGVSDDSVPPKNDGGRVIAMFQCSAKLAPRVSRSPFATSWAPGPGIEVSSQKRTV